MCGGGGDTSVEPTAEERALAQIATERYERYEDTFVPAEDEFIASVESIGEGDADQAAGMAAAGSQQAYSQAAGKVASSQMESGAAPGSGRFNASVTDTGRDAAASRGMRMSEARMDTTDRRLSGLEAVTAIGQGQDAEAMTTLSDIADQSSQESIRDARMSAQREAARMNTIGSVGGAAAGYAYAGDNGGYSLRDAKKRSKGYSAPDDGYRGG